MSSPSDRPAALSPLKQALLALEEMEAKLAAAEGAKAEPLALVGMGCRLPGGASDPDSFWKLLEEGADVVGEIPVDRWDPDAYYDPDPDAPGKMSTRHGAFLADVYGFDPQFFGISPREATSMDPQQRLLLEVTWEALEDAGLAPDRLSGSRTGVFIGICRGDYSQLQIMGGDPNRFDLYYASGQAHSIAAGRLSYVLGLQGPSVALDTACSSSLVALHLACQSLRLGECDMALVGGANLILSPENAITFSKGRMLASDGRCKTFDARADGFVEGEGVAMVVLKRLSAAQAAGDRILALIRGTAVNQDGPSSGLTAPNGPAQQAVIREALANGRVDPRDVSYVEAHGTGTSLGDPIEVQAIAAVLGKGRPADDPVLIGSVKTNLGHLESSAGVAGLLKVVLALQHREIPPHIHFQEPNPLIPWSELPVSVPTRLTAWEPSRGSRIAGLSSFGFSGTNAHIVIQEAPPTVAAAAQIERPAHLLTLSAKSEPALRALAARHRARLGSEVPLPDLCFTANTGRAHLSHRVALTATTMDELAGRLTAVAEGVAAPGVTRGLEPAMGGAKVAFLFTGQGSQYAGMGRELYETQPTFRKALEKCDEILRGVLERPLLSVLYPKEGEASLLDETAYTQPGLFAVEYALSELWRSFGIEPLAVLGHSVGEYAAACVAGVFSLEDGLKLIAERGRLMGALPRNGTMAAVMADEERVRAAIAGEAMLSIAAVNGPDNVVVSGEREALERVLGRLSGDGVKAKKLTVSHAFHSPLMEPMLAEFEKVAAKVRYGAAKVALISNVTGLVARPGEVEQAAYWVRHVRSAVLFQEGMQALTARGCRIFLEVGPSPTLLGMGRRCVSDEGLSFLPSARPGKGDWGQILESLASLYVQGVAVDWSGFDRDYPRLKVALPTYPFQRRPYRFEVGSGSSAAKAARPRLGVHPLLGRRVRSPLLKETLYETSLSTEYPSFVRDHRVYGNIVMPGAAFLEMIGAAGADGLGETCSVEDVVIREALVLEEGETRTLQVVLTPEGQEASLQIISMPEGEGAAHVAHVSGRVRKGAAAVAAVALEALKLRCAEPVPVPAYYEALQERGIQLGPGLHGIEELWRGSGEALGHLRLPESQQGESGYRIHPVLLDSCLQIIGAALREADGAAEDVYMPLGLESFRLEGKAPPSLWSHATLRGGATSGETLVVDLRVLDDDGRGVAVIDGLQLKRVAPEALGRQGAASFSDWLYRVEWQERPRLGLLGSAPEYIPPPAEISAAVAPRVAALSAEHGLPEYDRLLPRLDALSAAYVVAAFRSLGWEIRQGDRTTTAELAERLGIVSGHHRLLERLLEMLAEDGVLVRSSSDWRVVRVPLAEVPQEIWRALQSEFPSGAAELTLTGRCGDRLADVLRGACDPLELLFPGGSLESAEKLYQESPPSRVFQALAQQVVKAALAGLPAGRSVRILEIGAGTGGTTSYVVPGLPADRTEYVFTDVSPLFTAKAEGKFRDFPFMRYQVLDIEQDPEGQGFERHRYDVILAANVLHATKDLRQTMTHATRLLAPGGLLVVSEIVARQRWIDLTFGLLDGWWRFADPDLRPSYPLLTRDGWLKLLEDSGYTASATVPKAPEGTGILGQNVLLMARASDQPAPTAAPPPGRWLVLANSEGTGGRLAALLESRGQAVALAHGPHDPARLVREWLAEEGAPPRGVVHLCALDGPESDEGMAPLQLEEAERASCGSVLSLVQALGAAKGSAVPRLWLVTRGAQPVEGASSLALFQSPLWGMAKVIALEHPEWHCTRVDLPPAPDADDVEGLVEELLAGDGEDQVGYRRGMRKVARLARFGSRHAEPVTSSLHIARPGVLDALELRPAARRQPGPGEVEIRVRAAGLNFRDVLNALGMRTDEDPLGGECSGTIVAVGADVPDLKVGDDVVAVAAGCFADYLTTGKALVVRKPERVSFEEAATLPLAFLTADYALYQTARMTSSDRVLIHAAAGGVGMAALQLAQRTGAEVFATAGSPEKREYLTSLGVPHVMDSRSLAFADEIRERTQGRGVDVVLNSLAGEFIPKGLSTLAPGGRFLEIGKAGIWEPSQVAAFRPDVSYFVVDLALTLHQTPAAVRPSLLALMTAVGEGRIGPLPRRTFTLGEASLAFRHMAQARHIGKVVLTPARGELDPALPVAFRADGTYLITGGLGGLGLEVARWMAERGAGRLLLMGRRAPSTEAAAAVRAIEGLGARVEVIQGDVSREADVARALANDGSRPPLRGVIHSAGLLADGVLLQQDWDRFASVLAPKVAGSFHLHRLTAKDPLDFFVLFSSLSSLFGSAGQSNHAAANAFLDALAHHRRAQGQPASSLNWGAWSEVGAAAERGVGRRITAQGLRTFNPREGLRVLERLMREDPVQVGIVPVQWDRFLKGSAAGTTAFYSELAKEVRHVPRAAVEATTARPGLMERVEEAAPNQRHKLVVSHVLEQAMKVLGLEAGQPIDHRQPLNEMGLDSLMAVELRNLLGTGLGLRRSLPATLVFDYPSVSDLADYLAREVFGLETAAAARGGAQVDEKDALDRIEELSDEEVERLLSPKGVGGA